ncbi:hypothetical protein NHQ30_000489 [Ciborinia camelliae]|nr:hypothetical protein NHQ30_000489 [Ciborinia camelliae]
MTLTLDRLIERQAAKLAQHQDGNNLEADQTVFIDPEHRLPPMLLGGTLLPLGLFLYGWTSQYHLHWIAPIIGTSLLGFGLMVTLIPTSTYLMDVYTIYAASASAANLCLKNLFGTVLPLAGPPLYKTLGLGWGNSLLAFLALAFVPIPLILMKFGKQLRSSEKRRLVL